MDTGKLAGMVEIFEGLEDWRSTQQTRHRLSELLTVAVCAVLSGADDFEDISQWGRAKLGWLQGFVRLDYGVASSDTFERVFALPTPQLLEVLMKGNYYYLDAHQMCAFARAATNLLASRTLFEMYRAERA